MAFLTALISLSIRFITFYLNQNEELSKLIELEKEFKTVIFSKKPEQLDLWIEKAKLLNILD